MKKVNSTLHLWLGLLSGIVVFIVCTTGCLYAFKDEIDDLRRPWKFVEAQDAPVMPPHALMERAEAETGNPASGLSAITYSGPTDAVKLDYFGREGSAEVFMNPYSGEVIKVVRKARGEFDFFRFVLTGHRTLWLPRQIGRPIIGIGILIFLVTLVTGLVLWWPKKWNRKTARNNFTIKFNIPGHRINWKLHNVLGGYAFLVLTLCSLTGLVWSFQWFSEALYHITSGGRKLEPYTMPQSDTTQVGRAIPLALDSLFRLARAETPHAVSFYYALPRQDNDKGVFRISVVHKRNSYYRTDNLYYDRYTLQPLQGRGPYAGRYREAPGADKLRRMNLELHDGRILGLPGKILAFTGSLIGASLPVTGFLIWRRKKRHKRSKRILAKQTT